MADLFIDVRMFGATGDGVADDTAALQAALTFGATYNKVIYAGTGVYKISGPLTMSGPGLVFEDRGWASPDPGILVTGSGYTALTVRNRPVYFVVSVFGSGNAANGVLFDQLQPGCIQDTRVDNLAGFGVKISGCWDSLFGTIAVGRCGCADEYAFSIVDGPQNGPTNESHICRLGVEDSQVKAIYIGANTSACVIDKIHSERATPSAGTDTWFLGGKACVYNSVRLHAYDPPNATARLYGCQTQYNALFTDVEGAQGAPVTELAAYEGSITLVSPFLLGLTRAQPNQVHTINIIGGRLANLNTQALRFRVSGTIIDSLTIGYSTFDATHARFENCTIGELSGGGGTGGDSAATFDDCVIGLSEAGSLLQHTVLRGTTLNTPGGTGTINVSWRTLRAHDSILNGNVSIDNGSVLAYGTTINGTVTQTYGAIQSIFDDGCFATGAVTGLGAPTGGTWARGARTKNLAPALGSPKAWICTVAGSPGTWVSEGNL